MKSNEVDQIVAPPHPSRTATRCERKLRVPRPDAKESFAYTEEIRRNLRYFAFIAYRGGLSTPPSRTATSPFDQYLELFLRFSIPAIQETGS
ncbi:hypothetical protein E3N88_00461 [Mikania micrantha]|uniref:Uncharacterized protein n=1 Tax=Mikania micrantha TaxID=192012 RepID=A0A5N6PY70_9ASTR|nr:hypothetical protein E3N88_00461 [Mikania micrantha]